MSKSQIIEMYGEEKASAVDYGNFTIENTTVFEETFTTDDIDGATIIQYWSKHKGILRLREFSACGVLLYDSHKTGDRKENQKNNKFDHKPYYKYVNNKYPYFFTGLYPIEGSLWGFGDGKLLEALNDLLNDFYDKIRIAARPNLILFDPMSEVDLSDFDDNSFDEVYFSHVLEHVDDPYFVMQEIHRVCINKATVEIIVPHPNFPFLAWGDFSHKRCISPLMFQQFDRTYDTVAVQNVENVVGKAYFKMIKFVDDHEGKVNQQPQLYITLEVDKDE
jgi:predicted SAM-dependent methyltransferase